METSISPTQSMATESHLDQARRTYPSAIRFATIALAILAFVTMFASLVIENDRLTALGASLAMLAAIPHITNILLSDSVPE